MGEKPSHRLTGEAIAVARQLAVAHPGARLPCPACASELRAENLERHLGAVHGDAVAWAPASPPVRSIVRGSDRFAIRPLAGLLVAVCVLHGLRFVVSPGSSDAYAALIGLTVLPSFGLLLAASFERLPASIELTSSGARLRTCFGLRVTEIAFPCAIESGRVVEKKMVPGTQNLEHEVAEDVKTGSYLRLASGDRSITVAARKTKGLGGRWDRAAWTKGAAARRWDLTVDRSALVAIELFFAAAGALRPPPPDE